MNNTFVQGNRYLWKLPTADRHAAADFAVQLNMSVPLIATLLERGYDTREKITDFLFSSFEHDVNHPAIMKDMEKAVDRILVAIERKEKILIFGDYDVDGITSSSLMMIGLVPVGAEVNFFLPHRRKSRNRKRETME